MQLTFVWATLFEYFRVDTETRPGVKVGRYTVVGEPFRVRSDDGKSRAMVVCECECGRLRLMRLDALGGWGATQCAACKRAGKLSTKAERPRRIRNTVQCKRLNTIWRQMLSRCSDPSHVSYKNYGGRGIRVCDEWRNDYTAFESWALANSYADHLTIDRKATNGNYEPSNCRWATYVEQHNNRRNNRYLTAWGETKTVAQWIRDPRCQATHGAVWGRIRHGWEAEKALSTSAA